MYKNKQTNKQTKKTQQQQQRTKQNKKQISLLSCSTLCTKIPHDRLIDILHKVVDLVFKEGTSEY